MKNIYFIAVLLFGAFSILIFSANSSGLANINGINQAGSLQVAGSCAGANCHAPNSGNLIVNLRAEKLGDTLHLAQTSYQPGMAYKIYFTGQGTLAGYTKMGFQLTSIKTNGQQAGFAINIPQRMRSVYVNGIDVIEQASGIAFSNSFFKDSIIWVAPAQGSGQVYFNLTMLAANDDGTFNGDLTNSAFLKMDEAVLGVKDVALKSVLVKVYPNPVQNALSFTCNQFSTSTASYAIINASGCVIMQGLVSLDAQQKSTLPVSTLPAGNYFLSLSNGKEKATAFFVKQ